MKETCNASTIAKGLKHRCRYDPNHPVSLKHKCVLCELEWTDEEKHPES